MATPIFPDRQPESGAGRLAPAIQAIVGGDFSRSRLVAFSDLDRASASYLRQNWREIPTRERHALLLALAELADESVEFTFGRVFRIALTDPDPIIRQLAIRDLWEDQGSDLPGIFVDILRTDVSDDVRATAADALSAAADAIVDGDSRGIDRETLIVLFDQIVRNASDSPIVRRRALGAIAAFGDDLRIVTAIRQTLDEADQTLVAGAIYAMGRTASARWIPDLIEFMHSEDAELRFESARAAGLIGDADAVPELSQLVYDPDVEVRIAALDALGAIGGPAAIRVLREVESDESYDEPEDVEEALDAALLTVNPLDRQS